MSTMSGQSWIVHADADADAGGATVGGKGSQLRELVRLEACVPSFFCLPAEAFDQILATGPVRTAHEQATEELARGDAAAAAKTMRDAISAAELPAGLAEELAATRAALGTAPLAVRSSAVGEDGADSSFAGQFDTALGITGQDELVSAVRAVWASAYTERAVQYRMRHGIGGLDARMALVIQEMVDPDVAGVLFTADPTSGDADTCLVSATWGLGELLVSGTANADTYRIGPDQAIETEVADKDIELRLDEAGHTQQREVPAQRRRARCLDDTTLRALAAEARRIASALGRPQDIEFAISGSTIHILQARPITTPIRPAGHRRVWDNSNIVESYAGVVRPLTFSFAREAYQAVYLQLALLARVPRSEIPAAATTFRQMLGYLDGRVYYNLRSWYYLLSLFPGYDRNRQAMEQMMGLREPLDEVVAPDQAHGRRLRVKVALAWWFAMLPGRNRRFRERVRTVLGRYASEDIAGWDPDRLVDTYDALRRELLTRWREPIVNDFAVMRSFARLRELIGEYGIDDTGTLQNDLMCGQGDLESAEPTRMLVDIAALVRRDATLSELFAAEDETDPIEAARALNSDAARELVGQWDLYMERYGDRCADDLKLETPPLQEDPRFLYEVIRSFVAQPTLTRETLESRESDLRASAEARVASALAGGGPSGWVRRRHFARALANTRARVRDRENLRFDRTRVFGLARRIFHALGARFAEAGMLEDPRDVFFLEVDEVVGFVQGTTTSPDLAQLVEIRRGQCERWEADELPDRIETIGMPYTQAFADAYAAPEPSGDEIRGTGACPGVVEETVRVVTDPTAGVRLNGQIMACVRTDPGWAPLFPSCGGLLVERGSLLSHSAIVAREFGIPTIVGIPGLMNWVRDGGTIHMDGTTGIARHADGGAA